jgi:hypothetical protein
MLANADDIFEMIPGACCAGYSVATYVFKTAALVVLQETVLATEMAIAETAISNNALGGFLAVLGTAANLLARHDVCCRCGTVVDVGPRRLLLVVVK